MLFDCTSFSNQLCCQSQIMNPGADPLWKCVYTMWPPSSQLHPIKLIPPIWYYWSISPLTMESKTYKAYIYISFYRGLFFTWAYLALIRLFRFSKSVSPSLLLMLSAISSRLAGCYLICSLQIVWFFTSNTLLLLCLYAYYRHSTSI